VITFEAEDADDIRMAGGEPESVETNHPRGQVWQAKRAVLVGLLSVIAILSMPTEGDPAGEVSKMNVVVEAIPSNNVTAHTQANAEPDDAEINRIAGLVLTRAMLGSQDIVHDDTKLANGRVDVALQQVFRAADATYIRYSISNKTNHPYRLTTPDVTTLLPTQMPQMLASLKNHQIRPSLADNFRAKAGQPLTVVSAESSARDIAPGETVTGVVSVKNARINPPQLFQLQFGTDTSRPVMADAVL
jgi:hypothetical protein